MSTITVLPGMTTNITSNQTDTVAFGGLGTVNITGTTQTPIAVTLSSVAGIGLLDTINLSYANVTLGGLVGVSALVAYNIGTDATLRLTNTIGLSPGSTFNFTGSGSRLALSTGLNLTTATAISGFGMGSSIDVGAVATQFTYVDNAGSGTGGTLTLSNVANGTVATLALTNGDFIPGNFVLQSDGSGGTLVSIAAAVSGVSKTPSNGDLDAGKTVEFLLNITNPFTVLGGLPSLGLNDGGNAIYDPTNSTPTVMAFKYTVLPGQNVANLDILATSLNGASVLDAGGAPINMAGAITDPAGTLQIDTTPPTVTGVTTAPGSGTVGTGQVVTFDVAMSEPVTVTGGTPTLVLSDGGTAVYDAAHSTSELLVFQHTVQAGQNTPELAVTAANLNGATVVDGAGNATDLDDAIGDPAGALVVNTTPTTVDPTTIGVYRFFDEHYGTHFYTSNASEVATIEKTRPDLVSEGVGMEAVDPASNDPNAVPVYRFFDSVHGTHFFTASSTERDTIMASRTDLSYEPDSTFYEHAAPQAGDIPVYRFFDSVYGTHFYTDNQSERATILQTRPDLVAEGIGFYEPPKS